jgi:hypothetical protein
MNDNLSITFLEFAWHSLTDQQQFRINVKYELRKMLDERGNKTKAEVYRLVAEKYGYTFERIKHIDTWEMKD